MNFQQNKNPPKKSFLPCKIASSFRINYFYENQAHIHRNNSIYPIFSIIFQSTQCSDRISININPNCTKIAHNRKNIVRIIFLLFSGYLVAIPAYLSTNIIQKMFRKNSKFRPLPLQKRPVALKIPPSQNLLKNKDFLLIYNRPTYPRKTDPPNLTKNNFFTKKIVFSEFLATTSTLRPTTGHSQAHFPGNSDPPKLKTHF